MTIRTLTLTRYAVLGVALSLAAPALAEPVEESQHFLTEAAADAAVGNDRAADRRLFQTGERPRQHWVYDVDLGAHVARESQVDRTRRLEVQGPEIDFGLDVL